MHPVGSNSWLLTVEFADASAAIKATEIAIIAEGFESGPPKANRNELRKERTSMATQLPIKAAQMPRLIDEDRRPPKIKVANELA
jgi:hypothetical protein